jgi:hypothetical protein
MPKWRKRLRFALIGVAAAIGIGLAPVPAHAGGANWYWPNEADYRASKDFIPNTGQVWIGGMGCSGAATHFTVELVKTSNKAGILQTSQRPADNHWWNSIDSHSVAANNAYYLRWEGWWCLHVKASRQPGSDENRGLSPSV